MTELNLAEVTKLLKQLYPEHDIDAVEVLERYSPRYGEKCVAYFITNNVTKKTHLHTTPLPHAKTRTE